MWLTLVAACEAVTLSNPYGWHLHVWLIDSLRLPRPEVVEWLPLPWWGYEAAPAWILIGLSCCGFMGAVWNRQERRIDWVHWVVLALTGWQMLLHRRHVPFFAILFGYWVPASLDHFVGAIRKSLRSAGVASRTFRRDSPLHLRTWPFTFRRKCAASECAY